MAKKIISLGEQTYLEIFHIFRILNFQIYSLGARVENVKVSWGYFQTLRGKNAEL